MNYTIIFYYWLAFVVLHKEPKALIIVGTSCKLAPAKGGSGQTSVVSFQSIATNGWLLTSDVWPLNNAAKLQHLGRGSQGKEGWEVRIYTIKNGVKYLTVVSG